MCPPIMQFSCWRFRHTRTASRSNHKLSLILFSQRADGRILYGSQMLSDCVYMYIIRRFYGFFARIDTSLSTWRLGSEAVKLPLLRNNSRINLDRRDTDCIGTSEAFVNMLNMVISVALGLLVERQTKNRKVVASMPANVVITADT